MLIGIAVSLVSVSILLISFRLNLWKSNKKKLLRFLTISWILSLVFAAVLMAAVVSETYVPPEKVYEGYWYNVATGKIVSDKYSFVGGEGTDPIFIFFVSIFLNSISGYMIGLLIALAKDKASKSTTIPSKIFAFIGYLMFYSLMGYLTCCIYPIVKYSQLK
jgi:hypothetical protein